MLAANGKGVCAASGKILSVDRQTSVAVDLAEHVAAKTALQNGADELAGTAFAEDCSVVRNMGDHAARFDELLTVIQSKPTALE
jgi:hypothetical protein